MIPLLVGLGVDELSVAPNSVAAVREQVGSLRLAVCQELATSSLREVSVVEIRRRVAEAADR
jgi:phosphocarrier protein FPr